MSSLNGVANRLRQLEGAGSGSPLDEARLRDLLAVGSVTELERLRAAAREGDVAEQERLLETLARRSDAAATAAPSSLLEAVLADEMERRRGTTIVVSALSADELAMLRDAALQFDRQPAEVLPGEVRRLIARPWVRHERWACQGRPATVEGRRAEARRLSSLRAE